MTENFANSIGETAIYRFNSENPNHDKYIPTSTQNHAWLHHNHVTNDKDKEKVICKKEKKTDI